MLALLAVTLTLGWLACASTSIYLHRSLAHGALKLHPAAAQSLRFIVWLTTGTAARGWVAVHRQHHAHVDREGDPHSPALLGGVWRALFANYRAYSHARRDPVTMARFGYGCPDDWMERWIYGGSAWLPLLLSLELALLGWPLGVAGFAIQLAWMLWWGGFINSFGHGFGYRNYDTPDESRNILPWGLLVAGEELHNNHHGDPRCARFSRRWWELDSGWWLIRVMMTFGLASEVRPPCKRPC